MEFLLSSNLSASLLDNIVPSKRSVDKLTEVNPIQSVKSSVPVVPGLIPQDILSETDYNRLMKSTALKGIKHRVFHQHLTEASPAILLYYYDHHWTTAWIPSKNSDAKYLYGYSICYRDTPATLDKLPIKLIETFEQTEDQYKTRIKIKRTFFNVLTRYITIDDIKNSTCTIFDSKTSSLLTFPTFSRITQMGTHVLDLIKGNSSFEVEQYKMSGYSSISLVEYSTRRWDYVMALNKFKEDISSLIPIFDDHDHLFCRMCTPNVSLYIFTHLYRYQFLELYKYFPESSEFNFNFIKDFINKIPSDSLILDFTKRSRNNSSFLSLFKFVLPVIDTPYFRKIINQYCTEVDQAFKSNENNLKASAMYAPVNKIINICTVISFVLTVYPDCLIDYIQSNLEILQDTFNDSHTLDHINERSNGNGLKWISENLPINSFFNMLNKEYIKHQKENETKNRRHTFTFGREFRDIIYMIDKIISHGLTVDVPNRWRFNEFHDHVQAISWKVENKNERLPQVLFPEPIKVIEEDQTWTFFQPYDTHQLSEWGRHVRNCVGSSSYSTEIKKHKSFIVLCMINSKPIFTIQLTTNNLQNSSLKVTQIKGLSNSSLTVQQESMYQKMFSKALELRAKQV